MMRMISPGIRISAPVMALALAGALLGATMPATPAQAQLSGPGIAALTIERVPLPTQRPHFAAGGSALATQAAAPVETPVDTGRRAQVAAVAGSLKDGLDAVSNRNPQKALAIRAGMPAGSLDRKILAWAIALSGLSGVPSGEIADIATDLADWPGQVAMRRNAEQALARENLPPQAVIDAFGKRRSETVEGAMALAEAWLARGNVKRANAAIAPIWRDDNLSEAEEKRVMKRVGKALTREDHRVRMHTQFYRERSTAGMRMGALAEQYSLAKARTAVIRNADNADALLKAVKSPSDLDPGYLYSRIKRARRTEDYRGAAKLMMKAPRDAGALIDADEWWIERRLIARGLLDSGDPRTAYQIASGHRAESYTSQAEAEFHSGWIALRYLNDPVSARRHFDELRRITSTPISQARAHYWLGRSHSGAAATEHYRKAAQYSGTFYGQLAAQKLGITRLDVSRPDPTAADRRMFASRELVRAITRLEEVDYGWRAEAIYRDLARTLDSAGEIAILSYRAEKQGKHHLALQVGKLAYHRGLPVETVAWPVGAIPNDASVTGAGLALAYAVARQESAFNHRAISPARARGLLQLMPGTAKMMASKLGVGYSTNRLTSDPAYNATLGAAYLSEQLDNFSNSYILTFAGYNAGPNRVRQWVEEYGDPRKLSVEEAIDWVERIPYTETRNYVQRVMENYQIYKARIASSRLDIESDLREGRK